MSDHHSSLDVKVGNALCLQLIRYRTDPTRSFDTSYWVGCLLHGHPGKRNQIAFAHATGVPHMTFSEAFPEVATVWVGSASFEAPIAQRARIEAWIAANEDPVAPTAEPVAESVPGESA